MLFVEYMKTAAPDIQAVLAGMQGFINRGVGPGHANLLNLFIKKPKQCFETALKRFFGIQNVGLSKFYSKPVGAFSGPCVAHHYQIP